jgi:hypothetical protein
MVFARFVAVLPEAAFTFLLGILAIALILPASA